MINRWDLPEIAAAHRADGKVNKSGKECWNVELTFLQVKTIREEGADRQSVLALEGLLR